MKDQYFGDINDYFKYGILRVFSSFELKIGIDWHLTKPDETGHGNQIHYLSQPSEWEQYDAELFRFLRNCVDQGLRDTSKLEESSMVSSCKYFYKMALEPGTPRDLRFNLSLESLSDCDLVFFDPDNGIEPNTCTEKHISVNELILFWSKGISLLVFQYVPRYVKTELDRANFAIRLTRKLRKHIDASRLCIVETDAVFFVLIGQTEHETKLKASVRRILRQWQGKVKLREID